MKLHFSAGVVPSSLLSLTFFLSPLHASAAPEEETELAHKIQTPKEPTRSLWLALSYQAFLSSALANSSSHGGGLVGSYDFHISERFSLGMQLAYRYYPGEIHVQQLGYGLLLKHFFSPVWTDKSRLHPYVDYGLLQQQTFHSAHSGVAVSHDTRLAAGVLGYIGEVPTFVNASLHLTRIGHFDVAGFWLPYLELQWGAALPW